MYSKQQLHNFRRHFFKEANIRPFIRITKNEEEKVFHTIYDCAQYFCVDAETVWDAFVNKEPLNEYAITSIGYCDKVAIEYKLNRYIGRTLGDNETRQTPRAVKVFDIVDNKVVLFPSISRAARTLKVTAVNIRHRISTEQKCSLIAGRYIVVDNSTDTGFITEEVKEQLLSRCRRQIVAYNQKEGKLVRYVGLADFARKQECEENLIHIYYVLKKYCIYLYLPGIYIMFDPKRGGKTNDKEMFKIFRTEINRVRQKF